MTFEPAAVAATEGGKSSTLQSPKFTVTKIYAIASSSIPQTMCVDFYLWPFMQHEITWIVCAKPDNFIRKGALQVVKMFQKQMVTQQQQQTETWRTVMAP